MARERLSLDRLYILDVDRRTPVPVDLETWAIWFETADRIVAYNILNTDPLVEVSTIFIGLDYNVWRDGPPLVWETMIFGGSFDRWCKRYNSHDDAIAGHAEAIELARSEVEP